jgi:hypothetical protein
MSTNILTLSDFHAGPKSQGEVGSATSAAWSVKCVGDNCRVRRSDATDAMGAVRPVVDAISHRVAAAMKRAVSTLLIVSR